MRVRQKCKDAIGNANLQLPEVGNVAWSVSSSGRDHTNVIVGRVSVCRTSLKLVVFRRLNSTGGSDRILAPDLYISPTSLNFAGQYNITSLGTRRKQSQSPGLLT